VSGSLFEDNSRKPSTPAADAPLADRIRPQSLDDILGQDHLLSPGKPLRTAIERDQVPSMILWGPPGVALLLGPIWLHRLLRPPVDAPVAPQPSGSPVLLRVARTGNRAFAFACLALVPLSYVRLAVQRAYADAVPGLRWPW